MNRDKRANLAARLDHLADRLLKAEDEARSKVTESAALIAPEHRDIFIDHYVAAHVSAEVRAAVRVLRTEASMVRPKRKRTEGR